MVAKRPKTPVLSAVEVDRRARRFARGKPVRLSRAERAAEGKAVRAVTPLDSHAVFEPSTLRADPVELLERQATTRVGELVPIRYGRMLVSPFTFYRGAALVMAADLATTPTTSLRTQLCGDAHLSNFGLFASPERQLVFDLNDFDETLPGPFEWDVKRLAASLEVAARDNGHPAAKRRLTVTETVASYRAAMREFAGKTNLEVWYDRLDADAELTAFSTQVDRKRFERTQAVVDKARTRDHLQAFAKLTTVVDGVPRILADPPLVVPVHDVFPEADADDLMRQINGLLSSYGRSLTTDRRHLLSQFALVDVARKVVGVGSVGTRAWILLMVGLDGADPIFLQAKEAQSSVLEEYVGVSAYKNHGQRVVAGQRVMQAVSDIFLGWQRTRGLDGVDRDYYVRQLRDWKGSFMIEQLKPSGLARYGQLCGRVLARAHARAGDRVAIASYLGTKPVFDEAIADFSAAYADQTEKDHATLAAAVESGRLAATTGL